MKRFLQQRNLGIFAVVVALFAVFSAIEPLFATAANVERILRGIGILFVLAIGQMMVVATRNIDLSIGSTLGMSAMALAIVAKDHPSTPLVVLILIALAVGTLAGVLNGVLVAIAEVPAIIATLGTLAVYRGLVFTISDSGTVEAQFIPRAVKRLAITPTRNISWLVITGLIVAVIAWLVTQRTLTGRRLFAVGSNPDAARARGLPVTGITIGVFAAMGALAGLAGVLYVGQYGTVNASSVGIGFELTAITAVVVGGTNIFGGSGSVVGTILGCLVIGLLDNGLKVLRVDSFWQQAAEGAIILVAVVADTLIRRRQELRRALSRRSGVAWTPAS